jgi:hypothetical protein
MQLVHSREILFSSAQRKFILDTSITFEKMSGIRIFLLLCLTFASQKVFPQPDSSASSPGNSIDSTSQIKLPEANKVPEKNFSLSERKAFFQFWQDQFPSPLIMHFNGLPIQQPQELPINRTNEDWKFWFALLLLAILAWIRFGYSKDFLEQMDAFRNWGMNLQMAREVGVGVPFGVVMLNIFSILVIAFYSFILIEHFQWVHLEPSWVLMTGSLALVTALMILRYLLLKSAEIITTHGKELKLYIYYELQINRVAGIFLFPFILLIAFSKSPINDYAFYTSLAVVAALLIMRFVKGFNLGISYFGNHLIHFLIYICALEIAPILIVVRLLSDIDPVRFSIWK